MRTPRRAGAAAAGGAALALALAAAGCGTPSPDLMVVDRGGSVPGAKLALLLSDTSVRCNGGSRRPLQSAQTIEARDITRDLLDVQARGRAAIPQAPRAQFFSYAVRTERGTLRFGDTAQRPPVLPRLARFVRRLAIDVCGLAR